VKRETGDSKVEGAQPFAHLTDGAFKDVIEGDLGSDRETEVRRLWEDLKVGPGTVGEVRGASSVVFTIQGRDKTAWPRPEKRAKESITPKGL